MILVAFNCGTVYLLLNCLDSANVGREASCWSREGLVMQDRLSSQWFRAAVTSSTWENARKVVSGAAILERIAAACNYDVNESQ